MEIPARTSVPSFHPRVRTQAPSARLRGAVLSVNQGLHYAPTGSLG